MMLHSLVMNPLIRKPGTLSPKIQAVCLCACMTLMEQARQKK